MDQKKEREKKKNTLRDRRDRSKGWGVQKVCTGNEFDPWHHNILPYLSQPLNHSSSHPPQKKPVGVTLDMIIEPSDIALKVEKRGREEYFLKTASVLHWDVAQS